MYFAVTRRAVPWLAAVLFFAVEWASNAFFGYGVFIDEMYFVACARRLAWGYVDHPPLSIALLRVVLVFGDSLPVLRVGPAFFGAVAVWLASRMALRLGASAWAAGLSALATAGAPVLLVIFGFYSMNALEIAWVLGLVSVLFEIVAERRLRLWLAFGGLAGLALLNKHTAGVYALALLAGVALSPYRSVLVSGWLLAGAAVALLLFAPNVYWQVQHGWVSLEFYRNATALKNVDSPAHRVLVDQLLSANPCSLPILLAGFHFSLARDRRLMFVPCAYLLLLAGMVFSGSSRPDRIAALLPALFAAGAARLDGSRRAGSRLPAMAAGLLALGAVALAPIGLPVLSPPALGAYAQALGVVPKIERRKSSAAPQWFGDRFGWDRVARAAEHATAQLPAQERARAAVIGASYGYSGALERFGRGLPAIIGRHNAWHEWGIPEPAPTTLLWVGFQEAEVRRYCAQFEIAARFTRPYTTDVDRPIFLCRQLREPLAQLWPRLRLLM